MSRNNQINHTINRLSLLATQAEQAGVGNAAKALRSAAAIVERVGEHASADDTPTFRDQLAMTVAPQLLAARNWTTFDQLAEQAYAFADAMLKARHQ